MVLVMSKPSEAAGFPLGVVRTELQDSDTPSSSRAQPSKALPGVSKPCSSPA